MRDPTTTDGKEANPVPARSFAAGRTVSRLFVVALLALALGAATFAGARPVAAQTTGANATKSCTPDSGFPGATITCTFTVQNTGSASATITGLTETDPCNVAPNGSCGAGSGTPVTITCSNGDTTGSTLAAGASCSGSFTFKLAAPSPCTPTSAESDQVAIGLAYPGTTLTAGAQATATTGVNCDTTPPSCTLTSVGTNPANGHVMITITMQDTGSGLGATTGGTFTSAPSPAGGVQLTLDNNATVVIPAIAAGTTTPVNVTATRTNNAAGASVGFTVTDALGNVTTCDPAWQGTVRVSGGPAGTTVSNISQAENTVTIVNGTPGLTNLSISVNGQNFEAAGLKDGETRAVDISSALQSGNNNTVVLTPKGKSGGSAQVIIH